jgi:hypothetical protein
VALTAGTRFGPYEVAAQIGEGGMGEVYKATDTNLKRAVALKAGADEVGVHAMPTMTCPGLAVLLPILLFTVATSVATTRPQSAAPYRASELVQRWDGIINQTFESLRAFSTDEFDDEVTNLIDQFLAVGAVRAVQDRATEAQLTVADGAVKRLATAMARAGKRRSDGSTQVTVESFEASRKTICPQYPFCQ